MSDECEEFWSGEFGDEYTKRNEKHELLAARVDFFRTVLGGIEAMEQFDTATVLKILASKDDIFRSESNRVSNNLRDTQIKVIEFGANIGMNMRALENIGFKYRDMRAIEINKSACEALQKLPGLQVVNASMFDMPANPTEQYDLVLSMGLLIHIPPERLEQAYDLLFAYCKPDGHVLMTEYFAPTPTEVPYRGESGKLWRRDYGGDFLRRYGNDVEMMDYGFVSKDDPIMPMDDVNFWLIEKK